MITCDIRRHKTPNGRKALTSINATSCQLHPHGQIQWNLNEMQAVMYWMMISYVFHLFHWRWPCSATDRKRPWLKTFPTPHGTIDRILTRHYDRVIFISGFGMPDLGVLHYIWRVLQVNFRDVAFPWRNSTPGDWFNINMPFYHYRKSHCVYRTFLWLSYLHSGISYTGKTTSLYSLRAWSFGLFLLRSDANLTKATHRWCRTVI